MFEQHDNPETGNEADVAITLLGRRGSPAAYAIRDFLHRSDVPYRWVELTSDEEAREKAQVSGLTDPRLPGCLFPDGTRFENPDGAAKSPRSWAGSATRRVPNTIWRSTAPGRQGSARRCTAPRMG